MIEPVNLDYQNFQEERLPQLAVYSIFPGYLDKGLGRTFRFHLSAFIEERFKHFVRLQDTVIVSESRFLREVEAERFQAVKVNIPGDISFRDVSHIVASLHFDEFLKRHPWLSDLRVTEV